jgi:uncharacterized protein (TIGR00255 family)
LSRDKSAAGVAQAAPVRSPIRSMTGFARASIAVRAGLAATVTLKSVNHRFLDIQVRLPGGLEALEPLLREAVKKNVLRGHVDVIVQVERDTRTGLQFNADAVRGYLAAFRQAAEQAGMSDQPDLNSIFRLPGVVSSDIAISEDDLANLQAAIGEHGPRLLAELNAMRALEGAALVAELRKNMQQLDEVAAEAVALREVSRAARFERMQQRISELTQGTVDSDRVLQEAALLADRADIEEEIVRLRTHVAQFLQILAAGGECGKKLDFLLQEMNREANTLLSKTSGVAGNALRVTEIGLAMKSAIEKSREQIQNLE